MNPIRSYKDLRAWQLAFDLGIEIYNVSSAFPSDERFGLTSQIRRAAISVASNIAEGYGRNLKQDYLRFLRMARGSLYEVETQPLFAKELGMVNDDRTRSAGCLFDECARVLSELIRSVDP